MGWLDRYLGGVAPYRWVRLIVIGVVHGLAGSAAVALLVLATIPEPRWALFYLLIFGLGTIAGMMVITAAVAMPLAYAGSRSDRLSAAFRVSSGLISLAFGILIVHQIGVGDHLVSDNPSWTPR